MHFSHAFELLYHMGFNVYIALIPTLREVARNPALLFHPHRISELFMSYVWAFFGDVFDENGRDEKAALLTDNAYGVVLDIGAGHGHTSKHLDKMKVTKYIALEPNAHMHKDIRRVANAAGFSENDGTLVVLPYGAEEVGLITSSLGGLHTVDTLVSILALCSVPDPETTIRNIVDQVLKPGGTMLYHEHVRNHREDVARWQRFWTPAWKMAFGGCSLNRPTDIIIEGLGVWAEKEIKEREGQDAETLFWHMTGKLKKEL